MVKARRPWEASRWIKDRPIPKVPQIRDENNRTINELDPQFNLVHPLQFGGIKFRSTTDAGFFLTEYITKACNAGRTTSVLALDVAQFFPSLNRRVIEDMLAKLGFSPLLTTLLASYYDKRSTKYLWNVFFSKDYDVQNGVPQGDPLSPIISVLYLSAALKLLFP